MNFRTESLDFPQNEQRRCLSCDMTDHSTGNAVAQDRNPADRGWAGKRTEREAAPGLYQRTKDPATAKQETTCKGEWLLADRGYFVTASSFVGSMISPRWAITVSIKPYSLASSADM